MTLQRCSVCGQEKPATPDYFHRDKKNSGGLSRCCKECACKRARRWADEHPDRVKAQHERWNAEHPGANYARVLKWREENGEKARLLMRLWNEAYRARQQGLAHDLSYEEWTYTSAYFDHACAYCGAPDRPRGSLQQDHVVAMNRGGGHVLGNVVPACSKCNASKHTSALLDWYPRQPFFDPLRLERLQALIAEVAQTERTEGVDDV